MSLVHNLARTLADLWSKIKQDSSVPTLSLSEDDIAVLVVGPTGSGKSWFIKTATKGDHFVKSSRGYHPSTNKAQAMRCELTDEAKIELQKDGVEKKSVVFVDTPSFLTGCDDIDAHKEIKTFISKTESKPRYLGIIYMHRIETNPALEPIQDHLQELAGIPWISDSRHPLRVHIVISYDKTSGIISDSKIMKHRSILDGQVASLSGSVLWQPSVHQMLFQGEPEVAWKTVEELLRSGN